MAITRDWRGSMGISTKSRRWNAAAGAFLIAGLFLGAAPVAGDGRFFHWELSEFQPNVRPGGRANTIAVHPTDDQIVFVASESGGLFRSTTGGERWRHVDSLPCYATQSVAFIPSNPRIVLATTLDDFKTAGGGGIWRSTNGGNTWTQATLTPPATFAGRVSAYEISIAPDTGAIYVGTEFGLAVSRDQGASWTSQHVFPEGTGDRRVFAVLALISGRVIAGGPAGLRLSSDGAASWRNTATSLGGILDLHALGRLPLSPRDAFVVDGATRLHHSRDDGNHWTPLPAAPPGGGGCGGIGFIRAVRADILTGPIWLRAELYFSNRCGLARLIVPIDPFTRRGNFEGAWQTLAIDHSDTRDLAFDRAKRPFLLGTDGGLHASSDDGASWRFVGGGTGGFNALQVTEVQAQYIEDVERNDLYFGTQDNELWTSGDGGESWPEGRRVCCEGFFVEMLHRVASAIRSKVNFVACTDCVNLVSGPLFEGVTAWRNPPGDPGQGSPTIVRESTYVQGVNDSGGLRSGLAATSDLGASWRQFARFDVDRRDLARVATPGAEGGAIVYQAYRVPGGSAPGIFEIDHLLRIHEHGDGTTTVVYPAMANFGGLGITPTMFAWYQVFAVDPSNPMHVIASDVVRERVMETHDGGERWTEVVELTRLVLREGRRRFNREIFPLVSAISFSPQHPDSLLAGTTEGGIYSSGDNGATWQEVPASDDATYVTRFAWLNANDVVVSTYGRGLWRLERRLHLPRPVVECKIPWCFDPRIIRGDRAVLVFEGRMMGARVRSGVLREIFVTPGSSVVFVGGRTSAAAKIRITRTSRAMGYRGLPASAAPQQGQIVQGLSFEPGRIATLHGAQPLAMGFPVSTPGLVGSTTPPFAGQPYLRILGERRAGAPTVFPEALFQVSGTDFPPDVALELVIDGQVQAANVAVDAQGRLRAQGKAPSAMGLHWLAVRTADGRQKVLDSSMFLVVHRD